MTALQVIAFCDIDSPEDRPAIFDAMEEVGLAFPPRFLHSQETGWVERVSVQEAFFLRDVGLLDAFDVADDMIEIPEGLGCQTFTTLTEIRHGVYEP